jgi:probable F420-dependent oxidoreductase
MEFGVDPDVTDTTVGIIELARAVEDAGLDSLMIPQQTHLPASRRDILEDDDHKTDPRLLDPFVALGAAAAVTSRIKLGPGSLLLGQYSDPIIVAKQAATLDHISNGRLLFSIAPGWIPEAMRNHGLDYAVRWKVIREKVLAIKEIWTQEEAEFHGTFVDFDPILLWPKPVQKPHPPMLIGGRAPHVLRRRVAEYGDEWMAVVTPSSIGDLGGHIAELHRLCAEAGRKQLPVSAFIWEIDEALIERCAELGLSRCIFSMIPKSMQTVDPFLERLSRLAAKYPD